VLWCVPTFVILVGAALPSLRATLWIPSFLVMGTACLVNARGCGRVHCFVTGPLFLFAAAATTLDELAVLPVDWKLILAGVVVGTLLGYGLEWVRGKYVLGTTSQVQIRLVE
jgi:hypothetical protein